MQVPTKDQLDALAGRSTVAQPVPKALSDGPAGMPDPEPDVLEAARQLINGMISGQGFSEAVDALRGQRLTGAAVVPQVDERLKLEFLAHVMENAPYRQSYSLLGGRVVLEFQAVSAEVDRLLVLDAWRTDGVHGQLDKALHNVLYGNGLLAASLRSVRVDGLFVPVPFNAAETTNNSGSWIYRFNEWARSIDRPVLQLVHRTFRRFEAELDELLKRADDPSFWPTP